ncbi:hypothetical protein B0P06_004517 [Clostridium saccharoperbutylacetonicum]|uniref:Uncharacterized protein n=1 Tax=Clostridium saccharoperbutylacetonicum N1-4(HMT) TaxID=931276 RepID=M1MLT2_9CLOT|nr:hypothetical protein [Clostridium saccharoperbutylacetonicum]AGF57193.1 hypothetical protein Cspa_c34320 [Clostridium saccharoperbutylacetonicum N1-4(HMT)]NRT62048.1 hypothetical protein [Clostridium saccharoperbutylacetonicum]NSB25378.1 hypothetical protein [Clostridium saccharoperbutylacetonicum]NSB44746.1 hypothetical protein [Clostridium saccharoperbutylacetonicum]
MKRFSITFFLFYFISFNTFIVCSLADSKPLSQGIYPSEQLNLSPNKIYNIQNISPNEFVVILISDTNEIVYESIQLEPLSKNYSFQPPVTSYLVTVIGKGEVVIS